MISLIFNFYLSFYCQTHYYLHCTHSTYDTLSLLYLQYDTILYHTPHLTPSHYTIPHHTTCTPNNVSRRSFAKKVSLSREFLPLPGRNSMTCFRGEPTGNVGLIIDRRTQVFLLISLHPRDLSLATLCQKRWISSSL